MPLMVLMAGASNLLKSLYDEMSEMRAKQVTTRNVMTTEVVALWQNPP